MKTEDLSKCRERKEMLLLRMNDINLTLGFYDEGHLSEKEALEKVRKIMQYAFDNY